MPANLTPQYLEADRRFKAAKSVEEKVAALEEMLAVIPKHKGTEHLRGDLKRRMAKLKAEAEQGGRRRGGFSFAVEPDGAGQAALIGPTNAGKSALLQRLTNAQSEVGEYPYTTRRPIAGMMTFVNIQIQLVDLPAISETYMEAWVPSIIRPADLALLVADLANPALLEEVDEVLAILERGKMRLAGEVEREPSLGWVAKPALLVANKTDRPDTETALELLREAHAARFPVLAVSAQTGAGLESLKRAIYDALKIVRVYSKPPGKEPSMQSPVVLPLGSTVLEMAEAIHKDFARNLDYARVWGSSKFDGQRVQRDYVVQEGDVIELHC
jgi:small GTP-binding protein